MYQEIKDKLYLLQARLYLTKGQEIAENISWSIHSCEGARTHVRPQ
jgi:hypothetical protein